MWCCSSPCGRSGRRRIWCALHDCARSRRSVAEPNGLSGMLVCVLVCLCVCPLVSQVVVQSLNFICLYSLGINEYLNLYVHTPTAIAWPTCHSPGWLAAHRNPTGLSEELVSGLSWLAIAYAFPSVSAAQLWVVRRAVTAAARPAPSAVRLLALLCALAGS